MSQLSNISLNVEPTSDLERTNVCQRLFKVHAASKLKEIFYRIPAHKYLGVQIDETTLKKLIKNLEGVLKKEDSLTSLGYAFNVASELSPEFEFVTERTEDAMVQANEVDGKMLQFEGGF
ncbi:hypothetical protein GQX74_006123 [Glossina fuscipes]|nr:hypothetical protein GQX74_006123 [Glossina fuscipes]